MICEKRNKKAALGGLSVALIVHLRLDGKSGVLHAARYGTKFEPEISDPFGTNFAVSIRASEANLSRQLFRHARLKVGSIQKINVFIQARCGVKATAFPDILPRENFPTTVPTAALKTSRTQIFPLFQPALFTISNHIHSPGCSSGPARHRRTTPRRAFRVGYSSSSTSSGAFSLPP